MSELSELRARLATAADAINETRVELIKARRANTREWSSAEVALAAIRDAQAEADRLHYRMDAGEHSVKVSP